MYFADSLFGLVKNSTLEYQGVQIGKVENIVLQTDSKKGDVKTVVKVSIFVDKLSTMANKKKAEKLLQRLVAKGLHGQLKTSSLLTGSQYIALVFPDKKNRPRTATVLDHTTANHLAHFPTTAATTSLLNFDASSLTSEITHLTTELTKTVKSVRSLVDSKDIKKIIRETGKIANNINKMTKSLSDKGNSGELVRTLQTTQQAIAEIQKMAKGSQSTIKQIEATAKTTQTSLQQSLGEDSALQYKLQIMLDDLSETANSFSVLADTLQRKPNSVLFGK
jgi:paraquat-inducible protein B